MVRAENLRFEEEPQTHVGFHGSEGRQSFSGSERENLPDRVQADVDYRDVRVEYTLATGLDPAAAEGAASPSEEDQADEDDT